MILAPSGAPLPQALQDRGYRILDTLQSLRGEEQLDFAFCTVRAVLWEDQPPARNGIACPGGR